MTNPAPMHRHYQIVAEAIRYIEGHLTSQPKLAEIAAAVNLSEHHFQRVFREWAGVSPKQFLQYLTKERALVALKQQCSVEQTSLQLGLSSSSRLHDLLVTTEALTPGEVKAGGKGVTIEYGQADTVFGKATLAWCARGLCYLAFEQNLTTQHIQQQWPNAQLLGDNDMAQDWANRIFSEQPSSIKLLLKGSPFQLQIWQALLRIKPGDLVSYGHLAQLAGNAKASRAVGSAMASNSIAYLIPCHRVIRANGELGQYRWGVERKRLMQAWEACHQPVQ
ncbi:methylated-DNA--[protein]-cysteine S-methyltransferase [Paraferrimonas haliotis]|nr:methylated-DNA--[protein]-cysteine S-methyltransferase [Paraferrimonas haliotis]